ncbi:hypothetical protein M5X06_22220 [Paenibacillus alvei]|uniref:Phage protein n=1 Tax=Paenibacillus alvei TaxID=44250 RepID=A0ABT4H2N7_PAEAL|nr:hypothetical protein [Paenibacillus alvei]MCY9763205.1 hypothetical protein [Paenibacillus alvei]MCY9769506.1 hypothetical protein [Paenibacillus alvei]
MVRWDKLNSFIEENIRTGNQGPDYFEEYEQEFNGKVYRAYIRLDEFDEETVKLATVILGTYDLIEGFEHDPVGFEIPSNLFFHQTFILNTLLSTSNKEEGI